MFRSILEFLRLENKLPQETWDFGKYLCVEIHRSKTYISVWIFV